MTRAKRKKKAVTVRAWCFVDKRGRPAKDSAGYQVFPKRGTNPAKRRCRVIVG